MNDSISPRFTATHTSGHKITIHATGCQHATDGHDAYTVIEGGDTVAETMERALIVIDQDNDWPGWKTVISPCARKIGATA